MKSNNSMPTLWCLIITTLLLTIITGFARDTAYASYSVDMKNEPLLSILMQGIGNRDFPWENTANSPMGDYASDKNIPSDDMVLSENEAANSNETVVGSKGNVATVSDNSVFAEEQNTYSFTPVSHEYFDDALFIGDSRTDGLAKYSTLQNAVFYAKPSTTIYNIMDHVFIPVDPSEVAIYKNNKINIRQALSHTQYGKIYIMVGINELGTGTADSFLEHYKTVIQDIRALQPNAIIYIQSIMHVTTKKSDKDSIFNNQNINERNEKIKTLANNRDIFYLDVNSVFDDETGGLNPELTFDEIHLKASRYSLWEAYLMENGIVKR